ncbi:MAG: hypothetical protein KAS07_00600 [Candidatus Pacebacteria bacterium]|nr:hypothetical protein [Candidatus Paceibacterota bacterium]
MKYLKQIVICSSLFVFLSAPFAVIAADYLLLAPIGTFDRASSFSVYVNNAILFLMGAGTGLAVLMIAVGGMQLIFAAGNPSKMGEGKERIKGSIYGLVLLALSALILETINPTLLNIGLTP